MRVPLGEVARILGTTCAASERVAEGFSIDSRTILPGQLFFAIRGQRFDGHQFVGQVLERGAAGAVVDRGAAAGAPPAWLEVLLPVGDTLEALHQLARAIRRKWAGHLIAVTGSTGKTTAKELISTLLATRFQVHKSPGNLNNHYGLPLSLLALEPQHEVAVVELAMSAAGEIARLAQIAFPQIGVVTNVAPVHLQFFESVDAIARAKRELIENLAPPATALLNFDDPRVRRFAAGFEGKVVTFGLEKGADVRALDLRPGRTIGTDFQVVGPGVSGQFHLLLPGRHNVENALTALAVASLYDLPVPPLQEALRAVQGFGHRQEVLTLPPGITIVDDSYNSNPRALEKMLEMLAAWPEAKRRVVVAGEMLELGESSPEWHRRLGRKCVECAVACLLAVQGDAQYFIEGALAAGLPSGKARFFPGAEEAAEFLCGHLEPGDAVLIKGSRGVHLEKVIRRLEARFGNRIGGSTSEARRDS